MDYAPIAATAQPNVRAGFIRRTYGHLAGAILAFVALETVLLNVLNREDVLRLMFGSRASWLVVMVAFIGAAYLARALANSNAGAMVQYLGLAIYVTIQAVIFMPLLFIAEHFAPNAISTAGILTLAIFGGLTLTVIVTQKDFSFLGPIVSIGFLLALGFIVAALLFGFSLGLLFCFLMVALISACILYDTSQVLYHYRVDRHVAAALELFASIAILFWYVLQIVMATQSRD
jgi:FtsH-binding integral membrane protein